MSTIPQYEHIYLPMSKQLPTLSSPERNASATLSHDVVAATDAERPMTSYLSGQQTRETPKMATFSTYQALVVPSQLSGKQRPPATASQRLQRRRNMCARLLPTPADDLASITNKDWFHPLCSLKQKRQMAAEAYIPYTVAAANAEVAQQARLVLASIQSEWSSCDGRRTSELSNFPPLRVGPRKNSSQGAKESQLPLSANAQWSNDRGVGRQRKVSGPLSTCPTLFANTQSQPKKFSIIETRSGPRRGSSLLPAAAAAADSGRTPKARKGVEEVAIDALVLGVDAPPSRKGSSENTSSLPAIRSLSGSDEHRLSIPELYAELDHLLKGYSTPNRDAIFIPRAVSDEANNSFRNEKATATLLSPSPP